MSQGGIGLSSNGKQLIFRTANVSERQMSQGGKCHRVAKVLERQMSHKGNCLTRHLSQMAKGTFFESIKGKCPKAAFVSEGKWPWEAFGT